jgi:hypothetical protein
VIEFGLQADTSYDLLLCALYHRTFLEDQEEASETNPFSTQQMRIMNVLPQAKTVPLIQPSSGVSNESL